MVMVVMTTASSFVRHAMRMNALPLSVNGPL
jgi:hypothetical protein